MLKSRGLKGFKQGVKRCGKVNGRLLEKAGLVEKSNQPGFLSVRLTGPDNLGFADAG